MVCQSVEKQQPIDITKRALNAANLNGSDVIIFDTAGRTQIDLPMMSEIKQIKDITKPAETILVADSLTGQIAVNVAKEFDAAVSLSGIILTRVDGDARGGAALSMKHVTGKPIKYIGVGEKITDLELFHPDRLANRILGMGDVVTLVEKAQQDLSEEKIKETEDELKKGIFTMDSYLAQLRQMKKMGGMEGVMSMLPGVNKIKKKMDNASIDEGMLAENEAIILSMTKNERENPKVINGSRKKRISKGAGVDVSKINKLIKQFRMMSDMMKKNVRRVKNSIWCFTR
jgi:Signal recognition particle GTPase